MALIVVAARVVRVLYAVAFAPPLSFLDDDTFFKDSAQLLGQGHGYIRPLDYFFHGQSIATACIRWSSRCFRGWGFSD